MCRARFRKLLGDGHQISVYNTLHLELHQTAQKFFHQFLTKIEKLSFKKNCFTEDHFAFLKTSHLFVGLLIFF